MTIIKNTSSETVKLDNKTLTVKNIFETASVTLTEDEAIDLVNSLIKELEISKGEILWLN